jgi:hypothetical protein
LLLLLLLLPLFALLLPLLLLLLLPLALLQPLLLLLLLPSLESIDRTAERLCRAFAVDLLLQIALC